MKKSRSDRGPVSPAPDESPAALSRRNFVKLIATGSAAMVAGPAVALAASVTKRKKAPAATVAAPPHVASAPALSASATAELKRQKGQLADLLKTLRAYSLPPGSPQAFVFKPLKAGRPRHER